jgi:hypothetical protein
MTHGAGANREQTDADARRVLGVDSAADDTEIRKAYRRLVLRSHPDVSGARDATERTVALTEAYRSLLRPDDARVADPDQERAATRRETARRHVTVPVAMVDAETIGVGAPPDETLLLLLDAGSRLGEVSYLDRACGLLELVVEFIDAPTSSVLLTLQGRATGVTEVFCTVEPLSGGDAPAASAVARLLLDTLIASTSASDG